MWNSSECSDDDSGIFPSEEEFMKSNLGFLFDSDDEFSEETNKPVRFISRGERCVYGTSLIDSSINESWSVLSAGSLSSSRELLSKFSSIERNLLNTSQNVPLLRETQDFSKSAPRDLLFVADNIVNYSSPPTRSIVKDKKLEERYLVDAFKLSHTENVLKGSASTPVHSYVGDEKLQELFRKSEIETHSTLVYEPTTPLQPKREGLISELNLMTEIKKKMALLDVSDENKKECSKIDGSKNENKVCNMCLQKTRMKSSASGVTMHQSPLDLSANVEENKENVFCKFCFKNGEPHQIYASHVTKNPNGIVVCPILRKYVCDLCGESGDKAHTRKYCHLNNERSQKRPFYRRLSNGVLTSCHNHK